MQAQYVCVFVCVCVCGEGGCVHVEEFAVWAKVFQLVFPLINSHHGSAINT